MSPIVLEVQLNNGPGVFNLDFPDSVGYSDELWYPTVSPDGTISWQKSTSLTPPTPANIRGPQGEQGVSIVSVEQVGGDHTPGTFDTYRINFSNGSFTEYQVWNGSDADADTYEYDQSGVSDDWTITHNLGKYPSVTVVDSAGTEVVGDVTYISENVINIKFNSAFSGTAYLN